MNAPAEVFRVKDGVLWETAYYVREAYYARRMAAKLAVISGLRETARLQADCARKLIADFGVRA